MRLWTRFRNLFRSRVEPEVSEEFEFHLEMAIQEGIERGLSPQEARWKALEAFGNQGSLRERSRQVLTLQWIESILQDLKFAARVLRKNPGFTIAAVVTLALGIGANTAIFSLVYGVLLRPLPYTHPEQLILAFEDNLQRGIKISGCSYPDLKELQNSGMFSGVAGVNRHDLTLTGSGDPTVVTTVVVTPEIFPLLNVKPLAGRYLVAEDEIKGG